MANDVPKARLPPQIPFIIGNEACERFSFYGMRNILTVFLGDYLLRTQYPDKDPRDAAVKEIFHLFVAGVYVFPLLGAWVADRWLGKYRTILYVSLIYCLGHACLARFEGSKAGFFTGLFFIALGSGGIKPCVSAMVGDQFDESNKHLARTVFAAFYWSINLGSFFASLFIPQLLKSYGPAVAFGVPGGLMFIATLVFWAGRHRYVDVRPTGPDPHSFAKVLVTAARSGGLEQARKTHPGEVVDGVRAVLRVLVVFLPIPFFWVLFDQKASTWVLQAKAMNPEVTLGSLSYVFQPSQMQFINPALVMLLVPLMNALVYPLLRKAGREPTHLRRMSAGMFVGVVSWVVAGLVQSSLDVSLAANAPIAERLNIFWQLGPYVLLTLAEVLVSTTGLEFAYSQAPTTMKSTLMSFWNLTVAVANLGVSQVSGLLPFKGAPLFFFWAGTALVAAIALVFIARWYKPVEYFRKAEPGAR